jgi:hypothetical protein
MVCAPHGYTKYVLKKGCFKSSKLLLKALFNLHVVAWVTFKRHATFKY